MVAWDGQPSVIPPIQPLTGLALENATGLELWLWMTPVVFLLDVDNTLLDSDRVVADLMRHLDRVVGHEYQQQYWAIFDQLRAELERLLHVHGRVVLWEAHSIASVVPRCPRSFANSRKPASKMRSRLPM